MLGLGAAQPAQAGAEPREQGSGWLGQLAMRSNKVPFLELILLPAVFLYKNVTPLGAIY